MRVFVSYSRENRSEAGRLNAALNAAGYDTFLDTDKLPIGQEYNARIKRAIDSSDLFVFLASDHSVRPGSYAMTELAFAESKWRNPSGYVLPVLLPGFEAKNLPAYVKPVTGPVADGNFEARVVGWVEERASGLSADGADEHSPAGRLARWARLAQPPVKGRRRAFAARGLLGVGVGAFFIGFGVVWYIGAKEFPGASREIGAAGWLFAGIGALAIVYSTWKMIQGLIGSKTPVAVVVLERAHGENIVSIKVQTLDGKRLSLTPLRSRARNVHAGDLGWAYVRGDPLIDFFPA